MIRISILFQYLEILLATLNHLGDIYFACFYKEFSPLIVSEEIPSNLITFESV